MSNRRTRILNREDIFQKLQRMAYEIAEQNCGEGEIHFIGISPTGYRLAELLRNAVAKISEQKTTLAELNIQKQKPLSQPITITPAVSLTTGCVLLTDDVANTGRTLFYAMQPLLNCNISKLQVAVLVDRQHKSFPVAADFVGLSLATTLKEHITVTLDKGKEGVFLS